MAWGTLEKVNRDKQHRNLFLSLMTMVRITPVGEVEIDFGLTDMRYNTVEPLVTAESLYRLFTVEQAMGFDRILSERYCVALRVEEVHNRWIETRLGKQSEFDLYMLVCKEVFGFTTATHWSRSLPPLDAIRAIMSSYTRKEQQRLRGRISERAYRAEHRDKNNNHSYNL